MTQQLKSKQRKGFHFSSESVSEGHPDKICDQISDAILDSYLSYDSQARVAIECFVAPNHVVVGGEVASHHRLKTEEMERIIRSTIKKIGYCKDPFDWRNVQIINLVHKQSPDIAQGVTGAATGVEGAGDQGIMFGYACRETKEYMPACIYYAHKLISAIMADIKAKPELSLGPDGKCQITLEYDNDHTPIRATCIVVSIQHHLRYSQEEIQNLIKPYIHQVLPKGWIDEHTKFYINPTGKFTIGGPESDTGLTGRKIIVDTYGGSAPHGGGAFSGKDPSKVDRSAAYAARYLAKNLVAAGVADKCLIQLAYAIGVAKPLSIYVNTFGTGKLLEDDIIYAIHDAIDLTPRGIREHLQLDRPIYEVTATYGHFGRPPMENGSFSWEKLDLVGSFQKLL